MTRPPRARLRSAPLALVTAALASIACPRAAAQVVLPEDFQLDSTLTGIGIPHALRFAPDGHLFIANRDGRLLSSDGPHYDSVSTVLDLNEEVNDTGDRGMIGLALHPGFVADGGPTSWVYLLYTVSPIPGYDQDWNEDDQFISTRITRYRLSAASEHGIEAVLESRQVLLGEKLPDGSVPDGIASVHSSHGPGTLAFGSDGTLLVTAGDGAHFNLIDTGGVDDPAFDDWTHPTTGLVGPNPAEQDCGAFRAQSLNSLSGKLLRLDPETGLGLPSNPFFDGDLSSNASKVFALGFRNPYRIEVEPGTGSGDPASADPGRIWIGDVGQTEYEELDLVDAPGLNFGWPCFEGPFPQDDFQSASPLASNPHGCPDCTTPSVGVSAGPLLAWKRQGDDQIVPTGIHFDALGNPIPGFTGSCVIGGAMYTTGDYPAAFEGSFFFADYGENTLHRAVLDAAGQLVEVHAFGEGLPRVTDIERHPLTGNLFVSQFGGEGLPSAISRITYQLGVPQAELLVDPIAGLAPLDVQFDASGSTDPTGQPLEFEYEFGDGSPALVTDQGLVQHTYTVDGSYLTRVTARDPSGNEDSLETLVVVGALPPQVAVLQPVTHVEPEVPGSLVLEGLGLDPAGPDLPLEWIVDLHHNSHVHPASLTASGASAAVQLDSHGNDGDLFYFRVELIGAAESGLVAKDDAYVFPAGQTLDLSATLGAVARVVEEGATLDPASPANPDLEVVRDAFAPDPLEPASWFSTRTVEPPPAEEWIGIEYRNQATQYAAFIEATWTLGEVGPEGGALEDPRIETRINGVWTPVDDLEVEPAYPELGALPPSFASYRFRFDPAGGDALRVVGAPTGSVGYATCAELRVRAITPDAFQPPSLDVTNLGQPIARVLEQGVDLSGSPANPDPAVLTNGTFGVIGSTSLWPSFDSSASTPIPEPDWFGLEFELPQTLDRINWQLGPAHDGGGRLAQLHVEWRGAPDGPWQNTTGMLHKPPYDPATAPDYATYGTIFDAVAASAVRLVGSAPDEAGFGAFSELRVGGPPRPDDCGPTPYGFGDFGLTLSSETSPFPGAPMALRVTGAQGAFSGALVYAQSPGVLPLLDGHVLLVDPLSYKLVPVSFDAAGELWFAFDWPDAPGALSGGLFVQAAVVDPGSIDGLDFSAGLEIRPCPAPVAGG